MNELSWLIYLADLASSIGGIAAAVLVIAIIAGTVYTLAVAIDDEEFKVHSPTLAVIAVAALVVTVTPSKNTIYAIAASEMGEKALATPVVNKATKALEAWLDRQIKAATSDQDANEDK